MGKEARAAIMRGVDAAANAAKPTLGAAGANALLQHHLYPGHLITNDGVSIVQMVQLDDPYEQMGADLIKEIAGKSDKESGDGTTTSTVLAQAILHAGAEAKAHPMEIKRSLDACLPVIEASLDAQKKEITLDEVATVATVSAENAHIGELIQTIYKEIGRDGIIELDTSNLPDTFYEISEGVRLRGAGYVGLYSTTEQGKAVYKNPQILISKEKISNIDELSPLVEALMKAGKNELVIMASEVDMGVANVLAATHLRGGFKTHLIKAPTLWKDWIMEDFARITGATIVDKKEGLSFKSLLMAHLGTCEKLITTKDETRVIGIKDISKYVEELKEANTYDAKLRASWLQTKVATIRLGANSDSELSYLRLKTEDARSAAYLALQEGIVPGGGVALLEAANALPATVGGEILRAALQAPMRQIVDNAGGEFQVPTGVAVGYNALTGEWVNMWEVGIVDPVKVVKNAVKNAISVAGSVLTTEIAVKLPKQPNNENTNQVPSM